ncbi:MAG: biotin/lipoate A/B protein ligase family protein [Anaerolineaceae bacterium]
MTWRLIISPPASGDWNMAVDEALLQSAAKLQSPPTLRFYSWDPPCLSLGYAQPFSDIDLSKLANQGWTLVRRPTGGRAILHRDEITYSISANQEDPFVTGSLLESYRRISIVLLRALQLMGVEARADQEYESQSHQQRKEPVCFEVPSNFEITANGKKLIGSAQARKLGGVLQHGSLPLYGEIGSITQVLNFSSSQDQLNALNRVHEHATTLESILGKRLRLSEASSCLIQAFSEFLPEPLEESVLSPEETNLALDLLHTKYSIPQWNERI